MGIHSLWPTSTSPLAVILRLIGKFQSPKDNRGLSTIEELEGGHFLQLLNKPNSTMGIRSLWPTSELQDGLPKQHFHKSSRPIHSHFLLPTSGVLSIR